jgi:outer membrane protein assembly factor BamB
MKNLTLTLFFLVLWVAQSMSQDLLENALAEIEINGLDQVSMDNRDQIFISSRQGDLYLYDSKGNRLNYFSPPRQGRISQLEAAWTVNIFTFSEDLQEYRVLDRFLNPIAEHNFFDASINLAKAATFGNNNIVWVWDESDLSLKRMDYLRNLVLDAQPLPLLTDSKNLNILEMREFKNRLFVLAPEEGVFVFDNQGNLIRQINLKQVPNLCLYKDYLLWIENDHLNTYCLSTKAIFKLFEVKDSKGSKVVVGNTKLLLVEGDKVKIFNMPTLLKNLK